VRCYNFLKGFFGMAVRCCFRSERTATGVGCCGTYVTAAWRVPAGGTDYGFWWAEWVEGCAGVREGVMVGVRSWDSNSCWILVLMVDEACKWRGGSRVVMDVGGS